MIEGIVRFDDIGAPVREAGGGVRIGRSHIRPFAHRILRTVAVETTAALHIVVLERFAHESGGLELTICGVDEAIALVRGLCDRPLDWCTLTLDRNGACVRYEASPLCGVPLFAIARPGGLALDWDYQRLLGDTPVVPCWPGLLAHLDGSGGYRPETMVEGLYRGTAGMVLTAARHGITVDLPEPSPDVAVQTVAPGVDVEAVFVDAIAAIIQGRAIDKDRLAMEISGGMDSALLSLVIAAEFDGGIMSLGAQFDGAMGDAQRQRRERLRAHGGFVDLVLPAERFAPFSPESRRRQPRGVWPQDETYPEIFEAAFTAARAAGADTLISGFGGDELYPAYAGEDTASAADMAGPSFSLLTDRGRAVRLDDAAPYPDRSLQETCWQSAASRSQRLLRHGLWPVYPFHDHALAGFVARLPWSYRRDRALLRRVIRRMLGPSPFDADYRKENFRQVAIRGVERNRAYLADLIARSIVTNSGYVDCTAAQAMLASPADRLSADAFGALYRLLATCCFFD